MWCFKIEGEELKETVIEINKLMEEISECGYASFTNNLKLFEVTLLNIKIFRTHTFVSIFREIFDKLTKVDLNENQRLKIILDFSRLYAPIDELYDELEIVDRLIDYVGSNKYKYNSLNKHLIHRYYYSFSLRKSIGLLESNKFNEFMKFVENDDILNYYYHDENKKWIVKQLLAYLFDFNYLNDDELRFYYQKFKVYIDKRLEVKVIERLKC